MFVRSKIFPFLNDSVETFHQWLFNKEEITKLAELNFEDMSIQERINEDLKSAMKAGEKDKLMALRDIKSKLLHGDQKVFQNLQNKNRLQIKIQ